MLEDFPIQAEKYFWGDDLNQLNWQDHHRYITQTLLEKADTEAIAWLFKQSSKDELLNELEILKLSPKSRNFWQIYLS